MGHENCLLGRAAIGKVYLISLFHPKGLRPMGECYQEADEEPCCYQRSLQKEVDRLGASSAAAVDVFSGRLEDQVSKMRSR